MAPSYANLFMGFLEKSFLLSQHLQPLVYLRYIDDFFLIGITVNNLYNRFMIP